MVEKQSPSYRQNMIKELLVNELISDQNKIVELLKQKYGIETNQAVVSRDLRKLGVVKKPMNGMIAYEIPSINIHTEILKLALMDIQHNELTIVIKTHPGLANFVGDFLDRYHDELEIIGCLAGENVVFVTPKSIKKIESTYLAICLKFQFKKISN